MKSNIIHIVVRIAILILSWILALPMAYSYLDYTASNRRCGTGDSILVIFIIGLFSLLWVIAMIIEAIILNIRDNKTTKRNINLIMIGCLVLFFIILFL